MGKTPVPDPISNKLVFFFLFFFKKFFILSTLNLLSDLFLGKDKIFSTVLFNVW